MFNKFLIFFGIMIVTHILFNKPVYAADLDITCLQPQKECNKSTDSPLFSDSDGFWYPGKNVSRSILLKNNSQTAQEITLQASLREDDDHRENDDYLESVLNITLTDKITNTVNWQGTLAKFYKSGQVSLGKILPGNSMESVISLSMDGNTSSDYQNKKTTFNLKLNFWGNEPKKDPRVTLKPTIKEKQRDIKQDIDIPKIKDKQETKSAGQVLSQSTENLDKESWFGNFVIFLQSIFSGAANFFRSLFHW